MRYRSTLVYGTSWVGDAVMSLGAIRALKRSLRDSEPEARLTVLTRPRARELYDACEAVDGVIEYDPHGSDGGASGFLAAAGRIRGGGFDVCVLFPGAFRAAAVVRWAGVPERWGYATEGRGLLLTRRVPPAPRPFGRHQSFYYMDLLSALGVPRQEPDSSLQATPDMLARGRALLESEGFGFDRPLVGVHPGTTNSRAKRFRPSRWGRAAETIAGEMGARVAVLGGSGEDELADEVRASLSELREAPLMLNGRTSLGELIGVLSQLSLFLTNDSGPMHLAAALGTPTVAVFGPTDPRETGPSGGQARVVREPVDCSPCLFRDCPIDHRCMERVSPERVAGAALSLLSSARHEDSNTAPVPGLCG